MLKVGDKAPDFSLVSDAGETHTLARHAGKTLVVYFYPKDNTPGCTVEAKDFSAALQRFTDAGAVVVGVSRDSVKTHCGFKQKQSLTVTLLSDPDLTAHRAFGAWGEKTMYGKKIEGTLRSTFVIGPDGVVKAVYPKVSVKGHVDAVLALVQKG